MTYKIMPKWYGWKTKKGKMKLVNKMFNESIDTMIHELDKVVKALPHIKKMVHQGNHHAVERTADAISNQIQNAFMLVANYVHSYNAHYYGMIVEFRLKSEGLTAKWKIIHETMEEIYSTADQMVKESQGINTYAYNTNKHPQLTTHLEHVLAPGNHLQKLLEKMKSCKEELKKKNLIHFDDVMEYYEPV